MLASECRAHLQLNCPHSRWVLKTDEWEEKAESVHRRQTPSSGGEKHFSILGREREDEASPSLCSSWRAGSISLPHCIWNHFVGDTHSYLS